MVTTVGTIKQGSTLSANPIFVHPMPLSITIAGQEAAGSMRKSDKGAVNIDGNKKDGSVIEIRERV